MIKFGRGNVSIDVDQDLDGWLVRAVQQHAPRLIAALERELDRIVAEAVLAWPVGRERGRPHSRDLFSVTIRITPEFDLEGIIDNAAPYAYLIKLGQVSPWQEHVVKKVKAAEQRLADVMADELGTALDLT